MSTRRDDVRSAVEVYIDSLHVTLFLDWDVTTENGRAKAIEYVTDLWLKIEEQIEKADDSNISDLAEQWRHRKEAFAEGVKEYMDVDAPRNWGVSSDAERDPDSPARTVVLKAPDPTRVDARASSSSSQKFVDPYEASKRRHPSYQDVGTDREDEYLDDLTDRINAAAERKASMERHPSYTLDIHVHPAGLQRLAKGTADEPGRKWSAKQDGR